MTEPASLPILDEIESVAPAINSLAPSTPQFTWPLLNVRVGCEVWVKHENHTAIGSFKIRGALHHLARVLERKPDLPGVIAATQGNFGQAVAFAAVLQERELNAGRRVGVVLSGGNVDAAVFTRVLAAG